MNPEYFDKSIQRVEKEITLAKFLSELNASKNDRVVIYDEDIVFDSDVFGFDDPELFGYQAYWEMLEETVYSVSDVRKNGRREIFIFMCY